MHKKYIICVVTVSVYTYMCILSVLAFVYNVSVETMCMSCSFVVSQFVHVYVDMLVNTCDVFPLPGNVCCLFVRYFNAAVGKVKKN